MKIIRPITINDTRFISASSNVPENDYAAYNAGTTYALGNRVINVATDIHEIYESAANGNTGNPLTDTTKWILVGNTNRWRMFDQYISSITSNADSIECEFTSMGPMDSIVLLNVDAAEVQIIVTDASAGEVYNQTFSMVSNRGVTDWYSFYYEPYEATRSLIVTSLPKYINTTITLIVSKPGSTASVGACVFGLSKEIGDAQHGAKVGIQDYSVKTRDDFGNYTILERAYSTYANLDVIVPAGQADKIQRLLTTYRATPVVFVGATEREATLVYGFYKDFYETISYENYSLFTLELESLT